MRFEQLEVLVEFGVPDGRNTAEELDVRLREPTQDLVERVSTFMGVLILVAEPGGVPSTRQVLPPQPAVEHLGPVTESFYGHAPPKCRQPPEIRF